MTYQFTDKTNTTLVTTQDGIQLFVPVDPENRHYREFLASGEAALPAPAPPTPPEPPTAIEKLKAAGLTVEELKALLAG